MPKRHLYSSPEQPSHSGRRKFRGNDTETSFPMPQTERQQLAYLLSLTANEVKCETNEGPEVLANETKKRSRDKLSSINKPKNKSGETQLHLCATKGDLDITKSLVRKGADVNCRDNAGWTPLHEACNHGHFKVAKFLLRAGAEVNAQGFDGDTPLHDASSNGHLEIVVLLLRHGGNPHQKNDKGRTPIDVADSDRVLEALKNFTKDMLSDLKPNKDMEIKESLKTSPVNEKEQWSFQKLKRFSNVDDFLDAEDTDQFSSSKMESNYCENSLTSSVSLDSLKAEPKFDNDNPNITTTCYLNKEENKTTSSVNSSISVRLTDLSFIKDNSLKPHKKKRSSLSNSSAKSAGYESEEARKMKKRTDNLSCLLVKTDCEDKKTELTLGGRTSEQVLKSISEQTKNAGLILDLNETDKVGGSSAALHSNNSYSLTESNHSKNHGKMVDKEKNKKQLIRLKGFLDDSDESEHLSDESSLLTSNKYQSTKTDDFINKSDHERPKKVILPDEKQKTDFQNERLKKLSNAKNNADDVSERKKRESAECLLSSRVHHSPQKYNQNVSFKITNKDTTLKKVPEANEPIKNKFEANEPIKNKFDANEPIKNKFEANEPIKNKFEANEPIKNKFEANEPIKNKFEANEPIKNKFEANEPIKNKFEDDLKFNLHEHESLMEHEDQKKDSMFFRNSETQEMSPQSLSNINTVSNTSTINKSCGFENLQNSEIILQESAQVCKFELPFVHSQNLCNDLDYSRDNSQNIFSELDYSKDKSKTISIELDFNKDSSENTCSQTECTKDKLINIEMPINDPKVECITEEKPHIAALFAEKIEDANSLTKVVVPIMVSVKDVISDKIESLTSDQEQLQEQLQEPLQEQLQEQIPEQLQKHRFSHNLLENDSKLIKPIVSKDIKIDDPHGKLSTKEIKPVFVCNSLKDNFALLKDETSEFSYSKKKINDCKQAKQLSSDNALEKDLKVISIDSIPKHKKREVHKLDLCSVKNCDFKADLHSKYEKESKTGKDILKEPFKDIKNDKDIVKEVCNETKINKEIPKESLKELKVNKDMPKETCKEIKINKNVLKESCSEGKQKKPAKT
nr:ankyrin repeat domain-containing protein 12 [Hydra vulgaris]